MAWIEMPGVRGKIYVPEARPGAPRKHDCKDCLSCQMCSDVRCTLCRSQKACPEEKDVREGSRKPEGCHAHAAKIKAVDSP
ncbi:MAG: hypothetical protein JXD19_02985 [Deltaproteobacteria bacterium]|nr:hypothetical protein [Deltaproteobacteria bacterium]